VAREPERPELGQADRDTLLADFARSKEAGHAKVVRELVSYFVDYKADYSDGDPIRWSPIAVELCLVNWFPRKITIDRATQRRVPDALRRWVRYAAMRRGLRAELLAETLDAIDQFEPEFLDAMIDEGRAGPAKALVSAMQREGVDLTDEAALERWIGEFNQRPLAQRDSTLGSLDPPWPVLGEGASDHPEANGDPFPGDAERRARRAWSVPQGQGTHDGIDLALLDRSDPDDRRILIEAEHPELHESLDEGLDLEGTDGTTINPEMHIALHEVLANQLWVGEPPEAWEAARRLIAQGHDRHEILHQLMRVVSDATFDALQGSTAGEEANARMRASYRELSVSEPRRARKASQR
jgi:hypothetical protein